MHKAYGRGSDTWVNGDWITCGECGWSWSNKRYQSCPTCIELERFQEIVAKLYKEHNIVMERLHREFSDEFRHLLPVRDKDNDVHKD
jgi:hypothetical protein